MLKFNGCTIPESGLNMIRLHSFYPWHDKRAYTHFECAEDAETLKWVKEFNKFDLYSKGDSIPDVEKLKPYYASLLKKYNIDGKLKWWALIQVAKKLQKHKHQVVEASFGRVFPFNLPAAASTWMSMLCWVAFWHRTPHGKCVEPLRSSRNIQNVLIFGSIWNLQTCWSFKFTKISANICQFIGALLDSEESNLKGFLRLLWDPAHLDLQKIRSDNSIAITRFLLSGLQDCEKYALFLIWPLVVALLCFAHRAFFRVDTWHSSARLVPPEIRHLIAVPWRLAQTWDLNSAHSKYVVTQNACLRVFPSHEGSRWSSCSSDDHAAFTPHAHSAYC